MILKDLGITLEKLEPQSEKLLQFDLAAVAAKDLPLLPLAARALVRSKHEAEVLGAKEVRSEHLLLGLLGEPDGAAARVLRELGLDLEEVRRQAIRKETTLGIEVLKGLEKSNQEPESDFQAPGEEPSS